MPEGLYKAVEAHSWNWVRGAIENGYSDANERSEHDWTPLHRAVSCNYEPEWIEFLLALEADPNAILLRNCIILMKQIKTIVFVVLTH